MSEVDFEVEGRSAILVIKVVREELVLVPIFVFVGCLGGVFFALERLFALFLVGVKKSLALFKPLITHWLDA